MMVLLMEKIIPVLLLAISFPRIVKSYRGPIMIDHGTEQVLNEGETLKLTCAGNHEIFFHYPTSNVPDVLPQATRLAVKMENNTRLTTLIKEHVIADDTGYFGCSYNNRAIPQNDFNQQEAVFWKYIYVQSHKELFAPVKNFSLFVMEFQKVVIPCRPTSPNYTVTLYIENSDFNSIFNYVEVELSEKITFDPRIGFEIMNTSTPDAKKYKCEIILPDNKFSRELEFHLILDTQLYINMETEPKYLRRSGNFSLNCSFSNLWSHFDHAVEWETPNRRSDPEHRESSNLDCNSSDLFSGVTTSTTDLGNMTTCNLSIKDLSCHHAGVYTCVLRSSIFGIQRKSMRLYVHYADVTLTTSRQYAFKGEDFNINCASEFVITKPSTYSKNDEEFDILQTERVGSQFFIVSPFGRYTVQLITPNNVLNLTTGDDYSIYKSGSRVTHVVRYNLPIKNIDFNDEGDYTCSYQSDDIEISKHQYIKVYDPKDFHLRLIPKNGYLIEGFLTMSKIYGCYGETIKLIVEIDTPSNRWNQTYVQWRDSTCEWLYDTKYEVITNGNSTQLTIPDAQKGEMFGFCLRVSNRLRTVAHYFILRLSKCN